MAKRTNELDLRTYAVLGAESRLLQIANEAAAIYRQFPELRQRGKGDLTSPGTDADEASGRAGATQRRGGRPPLSAAERQAASERMKKYWAARRGNKTAIEQPARTAPRAAKAASRSARMSAAARKRISDAQKKRWADWRRKNA
jgi:hypothetical protein